MTRYLKQNAVCVINCSWDPSELEKQLPAKMRRDLAEKKALQGPVLPRKMLERLLRRVSFNPVQTHAGQALYH